MVKINVHEDCGNAPKKQFVKDFILSVVQNNDTFVTGNCTEDICWNMVGGQYFEGKKEVLEQLQRKRSDKVSELIIYRIVTHGYHGVADGVLKFANGKTVAFCDIYEFRASTNNAPIKSIITYAIAQTKS